MTLKPGSLVPDLSLSAGDGRLVRLRDYVGSKLLVIYFYPKDETFGCTIESCSFRDHYPEFIKAGAEVLGISADDVDSHQRFAASHKLPFPLLSDTSGAARDAFGVGKRLGLFPGRVTFVIDRSGIIRHVFDSRLRFSEHVDWALARVTELAQSDAGARS